MKAGDPILLNYGGLTNDKFLLDYGRGVIENKHTRDVESTTSSSACLYEGVLRRSTRLTLHDEKPKPGCG